MRTIRLKGNDGKVIEVEVEVALQSNVIKEMLEVLKPTENDDAEPIYIPKCNSVVLEKIFEYCKYHLEYPSVLISDETDEETNDICTWDLSFLTVNYSIIFNIITAAHYLYIKPLLDAACKFVANHIKDKTPEEIRANFNIRNDFRKEEWEELEELSPFCDIEEL